jgi:hypothetical protein
MRIQLGNPGDTSGFCLIDTRGKEETQAVRKNCLNVKIGGVTLYCVTPNAPDFKGASYCTKADGIPEEFIVEK